jgi:hypothetical protein
VKSAARPAALRRCACAGDSVKIGGVVVLDDTIAQHIDHEG